MTKLELKEWITELACSLDRGDLKIDELMNEVEEVVDKNITEQLTLTDVVKPFFCWRDKIVHKNARCTEQCNDCIRDGKNKQ